MVYGCPILDRDQSDLQGSKEVIDALIHLHFDLYVGIEGVSTGDGIGNLALQHFV